MNDQYTLRGQKVRAFQWTGDWNAATTWANQNGVRLFEISSSTYLRFTYGKTSAKLSLGCWLTLHSSRAGGQCPIVYDDQEFKKLYNLGWESSTNPKEYPEVEPEENLPESITLGVTILEGDGTYRGTSTTVPPDTESKLLAAALIHSLIAVAAARGPELHAELLRQLDAWRRA